MNATPLLAVLLAALAAGCAAGPEGLAWGDKPQGPPAWYQEFHETVAPNHDESYALPVAADGAALNLTIALRVQSGGLGAPIPGPQPQAARLTLELLDPADKILQTVTVDATKPLATLLASDLVGGSYHARVHGTGAAVAGQTGDVGARYSLAAEILYP